MENFENVIAIDGPSGCGKSTIAQLIAKRNNFQMIDTGALFRVIAIKLHEKFPVERKEDLNISNQEIDDYLESLNFQYSYSDDQVYVKESDIDYSQAIREHRVSHYASMFSSLPSVRSFVKTWERKIVQSADKTSILEGRDIGSVVFPNAVVKFFLVADSSIRAERRYDQLKQQGKLGDLTLEKIQQDIEARDHADSTRTEAPLVKAPGAIEIDTSRMEIMQVCETLEKEIHLKLN
jgi:cytidylate kinase